MLNRIFSWQSHLVNSVVKSLHKLTIRIDLWDSGTWRRKLVAKPKSHKALKEDLLPEVKISITRRSDDTSYFNVFTDKTTSMQIERVRETPLKPMDSHTKDLLRNSIVISLPFTIDRPDLEFISFSRLDHYPIYRYIGTNFKDFDLPYTEMISTEIPLKQVPATKAPVLKNGHSF